MDKPRTYLTVGGVDLFDEFGLVVTDAFELRPPEPKTYYVEIPGSDGSLDLTESVSGEVRYSSREMAFELLWVGHWTGFEACKTRVSNFLHGRRLAFEWSRDPGYTYEGRWSVDSYASSMHEGTVSVKVTADPYKLRDPVSRTLAAGGGAEFDLECGRMPSVPTFTCSRETEVQGPGLVPVLLQAGTWRVRGLTLREGHNKVWVNSGCTEAGDVPMAHWADALSSYGADKRMAEFCWTTSRTGSGYEVGVDYEWGDL